MAVRGLKAKIGIAAGWTVMIACWLVLLPLYLVFWLWMTITGRRVFFGR